MRQSGSRVRSSSVVVAAWLLCAAVGMAGYVVAQSEKGLSKDEARKLIAKLAGLELRKSAINVTEVSTLGGSATAVAQVETAFRFAKDDRGKWRVAEIRTGDRQWEDVELLVRALNAEKAARARAELETLAIGLEAFRRERGAYVVADTEAALVDELHPRYVEIIIRVDPWHRPYEYEGARERFTLRSLGPDGEANTADDVTLSKG